MRLLHFIVINENINIFGIDCLINLKLFDSYIHFDCMRWKWLVVVILCIYFVRWVLMKRVVLWNWIEIVLWNSEGIVDGGYVVYRKRAMKMCAHDVLFKVLICYPTY